MHQLVRESIREANSFRVFPYPNKLTLHLLWMIPGMVTCALAKPLVPEKATLNGDGRMVLCGINDSPEWALETIGELSADGPDYTYPDTTVPVRLYLIDSTVKDSAAWLANSPNLTLDTANSQRIRGANDPQTFSTDHATKMLSLIGGTATGIAPGTDIRVVNYDVYPLYTGDIPEGGTISLLLDALFAVEDHHNSLLAGDQLRSVVCIALTSEEPFISEYLEDQINVLVSLGIPVVVSAGNDPVDAATRIPASYGTKEGVICVGGSNSNDLAVSGFSFNSNIEGPIDLLAPGQNVRVQTDNSETPFDLMSGTSASAALVAGAVLAELSINGSLTPSQVEARLKATAKCPPGGTDPPVLRTTSAAMNAIATPDGPIIALPTPLGSDPFGFEIVEGDPVESNVSGIADLVEVFHGTPAPAAISPNSASGTKFRFPVSADLFEKARPFVLKNGYHWRIRCSTNLKTWEVPTGSLEKTTDSMGRVWLTATFPSPGPACYARIEIADPGSP